MDVTTTCHRCAIFRRGFLIRERLFRTGNEEIHRDLSLSLSLSVSRRRFIKQRNHYRQRYTVRGEICREDFSVYGAAERWCEEIYICESRWSVSPSVSSNSVRRRSRKDGTEEKHGRTSWLEPRPVLEVNQRKEMNFYRGKGARLAGTVASSYIAG